jgi:hypothetical protein
MNRYRLVDRSTFQTVHVFAEDARTACVLARIPPFQATVYQWMWVEGEQRWVKITGKPATGAPNPGQAEAGGTT